MVMADISGRDRGQRRQRYPRKGPPFDNFVARPLQEKEAPVKTPVILTKPQSVNQLSGGLLSDENVGKVENHVLKIQPGKQLSTTIVSNNNHVKQSRPGILPADGYHLQQQAQMPGNSDDKINGSQHPRLVLPPDMIQSFKIVDDQVWMESGIDWLLDQPDFLVIGVLGMQGVGKSTIFSHLAGTGISQSFKSFVFKPQNREAILTGNHMTCGIDMFVTEERTILLDSQAMLSPTVLDTLIYQDKKCPLEYSHAEHAAEIQSLKIASFMLTVCNVVIVVVDWFIDPNIFSFLCMAEMLKPLINNAASDGIANHESNEYYPHVAFVLNKAGSLDFRPSAKKEMSNVLSSHLASSKLKFMGIPKRQKMPPSLQSKQQEAKTLGSKRGAVNFFMLPRKQDKKRPNKVGDLDPLAGYAGHPGFEELLIDLNRRLLSVPRQLPSPAALSEKAWFHYAGKVWDFMKRSQMVSEYSRLLS